MQAIRLLLATCVIGLTAATSFASDLPREADLARNGLKMVWWGRAAIDPGREKVDFVTNDEEMVFIRSTTGIVTAFDIESGKRVWSTLVGRPNQQAFPPETNSKQLLICVGLSLYSVDKKNGAVIWELTLPKSPSASPAVDNDQVYIGTVDGSVYGFDLKITQKLGQQRRLPEFSHLALIWRYQAPSEIVSPPIATLRSVCFASSTGTLFSVATKEEKLLFQFETDAKVVTPLGRNEDSILLAAENSRMYCLNQDNGEYRWAFTSAHRIRLQPRFFGNRVYVTPETVGTYALNGETGSEIWAKPQEQARKVLMVGQSRLYAFNDQNEIVVLEASDGRVVGKIPSRQFVDSPTNDRTDRLFLVTSKGVVVCVKEKDSAIPAYHLHPERRPILPEFTPEEGAETPEEPSTNEAQSTEEPAVEAEPSR